MEQVSSSSTIQEVWVKENGREALVKFTYKDSARRVIAGQTREQSLSDFRCSLASSETVANFLAGQREASNTNIIRQVKRRFGIQEGARYRDGGYGD